MTEEFEQVLQRYKKQAYISPSALPEIQLYMDQVTTFMEDRLKDQRRRPEDKILTKTMINNYTKNRLFPPPVNKKYSENHLLTLIYIYYLKNVISIGDIRTLLAPMTESFWNSDGSPAASEDGERPDMKQIYGDLIDLERDIFGDFHEDIEHKMELAEQAFDYEGLTEEEQKYMQNFAMVSMLGFDVYLKKQIMEHIIDEMQAKEDARQTDDRKKDRRDRKK